MSQGKIVAEIAMTLTDKPVPTAVEILRALNKAYEEGFREGQAQGHIAGQKYTANVIDLVLGDKS